MNIDDEKSILEQAVETARVMGDAIQKQDTENRRLWKALIACIICIGVMACCMVWGVANAQKIANEAMMNALNTVADMEVVGETTTTTTTQSIEGDSATINNVEGQQYNDSATNNGGGE